MNEELVFDFSCLLRDDELKVALAAHEDVDVLQKLCEGRKVPAELRLDLWKVYTAHGRYTQFEWCLCCIAGVSRSVEASRYTGQLEWPSGL